MNLRIKRKKAKQELNRILEEEKNTEKRYGKNPYTTWQIYQSWVKKRPLEELVNCKRRLRTYYQFNETPQVDMDKLTYVQLNVEFTCVGKLFKPNGQYLTDDEINAFFNDPDVKQRMYNIGLEVSRREPEEEVIAGHYRHVDYWVACSSDRTKNKKMDTKKLFFQFYGSDQMYAYEEDNSTKENTNDN